MRAAFLLLAVVVAVAYAQLPGDPTTINPPGCGKRGGTRVAKEEPGKVVGGVVSEVGEWPWQIMLLYNGRHLCGGSIMNSLHVITAAHCTDGRTASTLTVRFGMHNQATPESWVITRNVATIFQHESYGSALTRNDISVLKIASAITYTTYMSPVCLAKAGVDYAGKTSYASGWGTTSSGGSTSSLLRHVPLRVRTHADCVAYYSSLQVLEDQMICAGDVGDNMDTCQGDSGGPLVVADASNSHELIGITSWGRGCGDIGVYARVSNYLSWIQSKLSA